MKRITRERLKKLGVPGVLIGGLLLANTLDWKPEKLFQTKNFYENEAVFPKSAMVGGVIDGDNLYLENGQSVRLIGINAPDRGEEKFEEARKKLASLVVNKNVWLEYDRYQDDKFGRILAWIWVNCESKPQFLPPDYMHLNKRQSRPGLVDNPESCKEGKLINELMVDSGLAKVETYKDRGELKYESRIRNYAR